MALVDQLRVITSTVNDDFFEDSDLVDYLNQSKKEVASYYIDKERDRKRSLRVLDSLRDSQEVSYSSATYTQLFDFYKTSIDLPSGLLYINSIINNGTIPVREITFDKQTLLRIGHIQPSKGEHYYTHDLNGSTKILTVYTDTETNTSAEIFGIKDISSLDQSSTELGDLPDRLERAVLYKSAMLMALEESQRNMDGTAKAWGEMFAEQLQINEY